MTKTQKIEIALAHVEMQISILEEKLQNMDDDPVTLSETRTVKQIIESLTRLQKFLRK